MASIDQVKEYIAFWFQLGKRVALPHTQEFLHPEPVFLDGVYSPQFESCWQRLQSSEGQGAYLEGTVQTLADLLHPEWEILPCARCSMPVPMVVLGLPTVSCPCHDLPGWPNAELPSPRPAVNSSHHLTRIRDRLASLADPETDPQSPLS